MRNTAWSAVSRTKPSSIVRIWSFDACVQIDRARNTSKVSPNTDVSKSALWSKRGRLRSRSSGSSRWVSPASSMARFGSIPQ